MASTTTTATPTDALQPQAADAVRLADLRAAQATPDVAIVVADREGLAVGRGQKVALLLLHGHDPARTRP